MAEKHHHHSHSSHCQHGAQLSHGPLKLAVIVNVALTLCQLVAGYMADSLSLIADALHNFGDAGALLIALFANKIAARPANNKMTYGYGRAEILAGFVNGTLLVFIAVWLFYSGVAKLTEPATVINAPLVIFVSFIALVIDALTAGLIYKSSKDNINIKAAFLHNLMDAMTSFVVMMSAVVIYYWEIYRLDAIATLLIAVYIVYHTYGILKKCVQVLMQSVPENIDLNALKQDLLKNDQVVSVEKLHVWQLADKSIYMNAKVTTRQTDLAKLPATQIKQTLVHDYGLTDCLIEWCTQDHQEEK